jgi:hypothetical protein
VHGCGVRDWRDKTGSKKELERGGHLMSELGRGRERVEGGIGRRDGDGLSMKGGCKETREREVENE